MEKLIGICEDLKKSGVISSIENTGKYVKFNVGGNARAWDYLAQKFRSMGYDVRSEGWNGMMVSVDNTKDVIDNIFEKHNI